MLHLRINGLVSLARAIRGEVSNPMQPGRREQLQTLANEVLARVRSFLNSHSASTDDLPGPTRSALEFVKQFTSTDRAVEAVNPSPPSASETSLFPTASKLARPTTVLPEPLHLAGLSGRVNQCSMRLSALPDPGATALLHSRIADASRRAEARVASRHLAPEDLTPESRSSRGWLAFFSEPANVERYLKAVRLAVPLLRDAARQKPRLVRAPQTLVVLFKPLHGYYVLRRGILTLPTAMIAFDAVQFGTLARMVFGDDPGARNELFHAVMSRPFQAVRVELDHLGGVVHKPVGLAHELSDSFDRMNERYFSNSMERPGLVWSRQLTGRKFGHYDFIQDTVMLSRSLDDQSVPALLVDYIMYHELLHKKHGIRWANGRQHAHTRDFRREEQRFEGHAEAEKMLQELAARHRRRRR